MMKIKFGTDGVRGKANQGAITPESMVALARTLSQHILKEEDQPMVLIGKDTRLSGYMLETALATGFIAEGVNVTYTGPIPSPAITHLISSYGAHLGVMLTASHNPWWDNGIKIFNHLGEKISDQQQQTIEQHFAQANPSGASNLGQARISQDAGRRYMEHVKSHFSQPISLSGIKLVLDCAHGAAYRVAPELFRELKADQMQVLNNTPDGKNINLDCGATDIRALQQAVIEQKADIGLALDGDADRLICVDQHGAVIDGDQIIAAIASHWAKSDGFAGDVVYTVMSNLGLDHHLKSLGITGHRTQVGDRHVMALMRKLNARLGGEQSGHTIFRDFGLSGDGILSAIILLEVMRKDGLSADKIAKTFTPTPQKLVNIPKPDTLPDLTPICAEAKEILGEDSDLLVRPSGTEPLIRIMAQARDPQKVSAAIDHIEKCLTR